MSKNIHDLSDDEFDDLFRESAEKSDISFDPDAWNKMSQKLDAATTHPSSPDKESNPLSKWGLPAVVVLLLLINGTYFLLRKPTAAVTETKVKAKENSVKQTDSIGEKHVATDKVGTANQENAKETTTTNDKTQIDKVIADETHKEAKKTNKTLKSTANTSVKTEKAASSKAKQTLETNKPDIAAKTASNKPEDALLAVSERKAKVTVSDKKVTYNSKNKPYKATKKPSGGLAFTNKASTETKSDTPATAERKRDDMRIAAKNTRQPSVLTDSKMANNQASSIKSDNSKTVNDVDSDLKTSAQSQNVLIDSANTIEKMQWVPVYALSPTQHLSVINLRLPNVSFESPALAPVTMPRANTAFRKGLNIRLAISPDLSFIPSNKIFKVGNNWAAIAEYRFNNRLSIQTGVIRSLKYYGALPNQYELNPYWTIPSPLKDIDATCKMLDIPLNIRYDISQKPNSRWFIGGGFTSYIMLKEEYRYNYENPADPNIKRTSWEGKTGAYPFSVLNLSAGYELQLFRRLTFQAEPFYKAPLGKVGYGKVRLATAGVFFSVKYPF